MLKRLSGKRAIFAEAMSSQGKIAIMSSPRKPLLTLWLTNQPWAVTETMFRKGIEDKNERNTHRYTTRIEVASNCQAHRCEGGVLILRLYQPVAGQKAVDQNVQVCGAIVCGEKGAIRARRMKELQCPMEIILKS